MKTTILFLFLAFSFVHLDINAQTFTCENSTPAPVCPPVGDPFYDFTCFASIEKFLARAIAMDGITSVNRNTGDPNCDNNNACNLPYHECPHGGHCPQRYCEDIQALTQINAQFIRRAAGFWQDEWILVPPYDYWDKAAQTVIDINRAYDCANLRRPIIQAAILENVTNDVSYITIPQYVKNAFMSDPDYINASPYYNNQVNFQRLNIIKPQSTNTPDLNRIEARMWIYFLATNYINRGYKALHMGDINVMITNDVGNAKTYDLFMKIRAYATSLPASTFVLIDANVHHDVYLNNTNQLLLDFNSAPTRAEEVTTLDGSPCDVWGTIQYANAPVKLNAKLEIDPGCGLISNSTGGISPLGCSYPYTPYFLEVDHCPYPQHYGGLSVTNSCGNIWGTDELNWFYNIQSDQCRDHLIKKFYTQVRQFEYKGFFQPVGSKGVDVTNQNYMNNFVWRIERFRLVDHPSTLTTLKDLWQVNPVNSMGGTKRCMNAIGFCPYPIPGLTLRRINKYDFFVPNADQSSIYSFHIQDPNGSWLPFSYGANRTIYPTMTGNYTIYIRQDNIGLPNNYNTVKEISFKVFLYRYCCGNMNMKVAGSENYEGDSIEFHMNDEFQPYYDYLADGGLIEYTSDMETEDSLRALLEDGERKNVNFANDNNTNLEYNVHPNPSIGTFNLRILSPASQSVSIRLKNILGQTVKELDNNIQVEENVEWNKNYNLNSLSQSVYFIEITDNTGKNHYMKIVLGE